MFLEFYHLREQPFGVTPDPRFLYLSPTHAEALASLYYGVESARGFLSLIARPGMGKTTLLTTLQQRLRDRARFLFVSQTQCNSRELLRSILRSLGESESQDLLEMQDKMTQFLAREALADRRFVLVIDEAQNLDESVLETVRLLSNCETPTTKLLQILLAGQPQLATKLASPGLEQFRQRIGMSIRVSPLSVEETARYIAFRLQVAGSHRGSLFSTGALEGIATLSQGIPRSINNLAFGALSLGYATGQKKVGMDLVKEAASDLGLEPPAGTLSAPAKKAILPSVIKSTPLLSSPEMEASPSKAIRRLIVALTAAALLLILADLPMSSVRWSRLVAIGRATLTRVQAEFPDPSPGRRGPWEPTHDPVTKPEPAAGGLPTFDSAAGAVIPQSDGFELEVRAPAIDESPVTDIYRASSVSDGSPMSIIIQRGDTLRTICKKYFGSKDSNILATLLSLNPSITNPNHVEAGQRIRLPLVTALREKQVVAKENN